jgi:hypothetical protein
MVLHLQVLEVVAEGHQAILSAVEVEQADQQQIFL